MPISSGRHQVQPATSATAHTTNPTAGTGVLARVGYEVAERIGERDRQEDLSVARALDLELDDRDIDLVDGFIEDPYRREVAIDLGGIEPFVFRLGEFDELASNDDAPGIQSTRGVGWLGSVSQNFRFLLPSVTPRRKYRPSPS